MKTLSFTILLLCSIFYVNGQEEVSSEPNRVSHEVNNPILFDNGAMGVKTGITASIMYFGIDESEDGLLSTNVFYGLNDNLSFRASIATENLDDLFSWHLGANYNYKVKEKIRVAAAANYMRLPAADFIGAEATNIYSLGLYASYGDTKKLFTIGYTAIHNPDDEEFEFLGFGNGLEIDNGLKLDGEVQVIDKLRVFSKNSFGLLKSDAFFEEITISQWHLKNGLSYSLGAFDLSAGAFTFVQKFDDDKHHDTIFFLGATGHF